MTLTNIGPFDHLDLELDPRWNILLGDNGVGKSSVLRAIAVALCGRDAQPFAERLLKFGQTSGQIVLKFADGQEHVTELFRTSGEAEVKSPSARLMDIDGWLALGFPALRTVTWHRSRGPQLEEGKKRPNPTDLIPLLDGGPDPRTDQLKQWIINVDYRAKKSASDEDRRRYARLLDDFFRVINSLTGGLRIGFGQVDLDRGQVLLSTDDGPVPLEAVSQGTVSLLGWIGVLMQRLYEVYDDVERPHEQFALVLMDEIDAHMHPEWQQRLVPALAELFPHIQFLATTHSPLIVGGMDVKQIKGSSATRTAKVRLIELDPDTTMGRTDQVLTGELFGLETTLDSATQQAVARYQEILALPSRSAEQDDELRRLEETLAFRIPPPYESTPQRRAIEMLQTLLATHVITDAPEGEAVKTELLASGRGDPEREGRQAPEDVRPREATATLRVTTLIRIDFDPNQLTPDQKQWWDAWQTKAGDATKAVIDQWLATGKVSSKDDFDDRIWGELKAWLLDQVFHNKCADCETDLDRQFGEAEHFRPKAGVNFRAEGNKRLTRATGLDETRARRRSPRILLACVPLEEPVPVVQGLQQRGGKE